ncbi:MAG: hypothetical protein KGY48_01190 [Wenzhouxiangellaceae bacterium]|nr:hypothetical protein [Wenzhouxiangellaceae bacterium]MBS3746527.1 hypothetical protein [Wenzhouxiangellaceae bacterium]MBS3822723.1 hypothetical protein [Wenzhouxiangellaceae bacterium]
MSRARLISTLFCGGLLGLLLSWWNWDRFAEAMVLDPALDEAPRQFQVDEPAFMVHANEVDYRVQPLYNYELTGLVVSFKRFRPGFGIHERWNDYINIADICVVWGDNVRDVDLNAFDFWNLSFTCNYSTRSQADWERFNADQLSNNHILTNDGRLKDEIRKLEVGDQIHLRGWLSEYGQPDGPIRGTSTVRTDTGDGACETIYLSEFTILDSMETGWRRLWWPSLFVLIIALALWWLTPYHKLKGY